MSNPTPPAAPETLAAAVEKLPWARTFAADGVENESRVLVVRRDVLALAAQHDAEMARLRQERDDARELAQRFIDAVAGGGHSARTDWSIKPALTRAQAEAKLTDDALYEIWSEFNAERDWMRQRILDTLFGHGDPTA